jgi:hypothetical protein
MPQVLVQYRGELVESTRQNVLKNLKRAIRVRASGELSVSERQLGEGDFSFMFLKEGPEDELIHDVQVIILAHAYESRVNTSDGLAESLGHAIEEVLANHKCYHPRELTYSVSLFLAEMGYHAGGVESQ